MLGQLKNKLRQKKGFTLVELMAAFALLAIMTAAAVLAVSQVLTIYSRNQKLNQAKSTADTLVERIAAELQGATENVFIENSTGELMSIGYKNGRREPVIISVDNEGHLLLHYCRLLYYDDGGNKVREPVDWRFTQGVYMNNVISKLTFEKVAGYENLVALTLELSDEAGNYTYTTNTIIQCYNIGSNLTTTISNVDKITEQNGFNDEAV